MSQTTFATFQIPVAPHVRKFLKASYGPEYKVSQNDLLGMMVSPFFSKEVKINRRKLSDSRKREIYPISVSYDFFERQGFFLSNDQSKLIGRMLDKYFREMLYSHVIIYSFSSDADQKKAIIEFCEAFDITTDDIDPETLYRDFFRKKSDERGGFISNLNRNVVKK